MRKLLWLVGLVIVPALAAQDSSGSGDGAERERLQQQIEDRVAQRVKSQLGLTDDQANRLRSTEENFRQRRRDLFQRQLTIEQGLRDQMRPGVAANSDSVRRLMDARQSVRADQLRLDQDQDKEMAGYLTPVQRAQYQMIRERIRQRLQELRRERIERRQGGGGPAVRRPRAGGRRRP
jgi:hypothetical protein